MFDTGAMAVLAELQELVRPTTLAVERSMPVLAAVSSLFPAGGLTRGTTVGVTGSTSLALALAAGPSQAGSWTAMVGTASVGWAAAADLGLVLGRTLVVPEVAAGDWPTVTAALVDAVDVVVVSPQHPVRERDIRRLTSRARERGSVIVVSSPRFGWPMPTDVSFEVMGKWEGVGVGHGRLRSRRVTVTVSGRRAAARSQRIDLTLPDPSGAASPSPSPLTLRPAFGDSERASVA